MVELNEKVFTQYRRKQIAELRPWREGDDMAGISVSREDVRAGSPRPGDMIARNPKNHADQWLVAAAYFADNFEPATALQSNEAAEQQVQKLTAEKATALELLNHLIAWIVHDCGAEVPFTDEQDATYQALNGAKP